MFCRPGLGKVTPIADWETGTWATTTPSARRTNTPLGVPEELLTPTLNVTGFSSRAGLTVEDKVTVGAPKAGELLLTKTEPPPPLELLPNAVLVVTSTPPVKLAEKVCEPEVVITVSRAAHP